MKLDRRLSEELIRRHPERAAVALELAGQDETVRVLSRTAERDAAPVLQRMTPQHAAAVLETLEIAKVAEIVDALPLDVAARLVRRIASERADAALGKMNARRARALRSLLTFAEGSAGALMDPEVLALPETLTAREALDKVRQAAERARYNLYIVDANQHLTGALNLRELLLARPGDRLMDLMVREPLRLEARADRASVVAHRGWREVHSLPVVDEHGGYLGAVRYRTLRALEDEFFGRNAADADAREALGQLFAAGAGALFDALSTPPTRSPSAPTTREK